MPGDRGGPHRDGFQAARDGAVGFQGSSGAPAAADRRDRASEARAASRPHLMLSAPFEVRDHDFDRRTGSVAGVRRRGAGAGAVSGTWWWGGASSTSPARGQASLSPERQQTSKTLCTRKHKHVNGLLLTQAQAERSGPRKKEPNIFIKFPRISRKAD